MSEYNFIINHLNVNQSYVSTSVHIYLVKIAKLGIENYK